MAMVLIVDDDAATRLLWSGIFQRAGHTTVLADDGMSALAAYGHGRPNLVVTDLHLLELHGLELIARLRTADPLVNIIAMSADYKDLETARHLGASFICLKPVDMNEMLSAAHQLLSAPRPSLR